MTRVETVQVGVWSVASLGPDLVLTRFRLPHEAHATLLQWCEEKLGRERPWDTITLRGLTEILAWFVPEIAFVRHERGTDGARRLALYFVGDVASDIEMRQRVQAGIAMWLSVLY